MLVILVIIQASCMVWRDKRNERNHLSKLANGGHISAPHLMKGHPNGVVEKQQMHANGGWKEYPPPITSNGYSYENFGEELDEPTLNAKKQRRANGKQHFGGGGGGTLGDKGPNGYGHPGDGMGPRLGHERARGDGFRGHFAQPHLTPDFYFMPHQRRYSGEVVRVFVDYNNPQYVPK